MWISWSCSSRWSRCVTGCSFGVGFILERWCVGPLVGVLWWVVVGVVFGWLGDVLVGWEDDAGWVFEDFWCESDSGVPVSASGSVLVDGVGVSFWLGGEDVDFLGWGDGCGVEVGEDSVDEDFPDCGFAVWAGGWLSEVGGSGWFEFGHGLWGLARAFTLPL